MTPELEIVARRLIEGGVPPFATAGIIANLAHESGGDPEAVGDGNTSIGLAQWHGPRAEALMDFATRQGASPKSPSVQADFLLSELANHPNLIEKMAKAGDAAGAADVFQRLYEKPAEIDPTRSETAVAAEEWLQRKGLDPQGAASRMVPVGGTGQPAVYPSSRSVPQEQGFMARVVEGAKQGFGAGPIGPSEETLATVRPFGPIAEQAVRSVGTAGDLLGRAVGAVTGAGAAALGGGARALGETETGARQLERDVKTMADLGLMAAPLASPTGLITPSALAPKAAPAPTLAGKVEGIPPEVSLPPKPPAAMLTQDALAAFREGKPIDPLAKPATVPNLGRIISTGEAQNLT